MPMPTWLQYSVGPYARTCIGANKNNESGGIQLDQQLQDMYYRKEDRMTICTEEEEAGLSGFYIGPCKLEVLCPGLKCVSSAPGAATVWNHKISCVLDWCYQE